MNLSLLQAIQTKHATGFTGKADKGIAKMTHVIQLPNNQEALHHNGKWIIVSPYGSSIEHENLSIALRQAGFSEEIIDQICADDEELERWDGMS